ncbi:hypothetical protein [Ruegeria sp.]|uniref:VpaChn25_0724 family phage protein n=1 Tax=Ruegeria sp. TaxID=1879320 RepID=UPI003AFF9D21
MSYAATLDAHRRLAILTHLSACLEYASNSEILMDVCNGLGITTSRDRLVSTLAWLSEQELVTLEDHEGFVLASATARGVDIAQGRALHPGVRRPAPKGP